MTYFILFISAFGAATLLPLQSEAVLVASLYHLPNSAWLLIAVASVGNILGSCVNWYLGLKIEQFKHKKWFPVSVGRLAQAQQVYQKYGSWSLLLSWVPVIGDPITLIAGLLKEKFWRFICIVSIAKTVRYIFIYMIFLGLF